MSFSKYSACGNDFILVDDRENQFPIQNHALIKKMCDRQNGIGADGIVLLQKSERADYKMRILNRDGSEAEMCGNGLRCLSHWVTLLGEKRTRFKIESLQRLHHVEITSSGVKAAMGSPVDMKKDISLAHLGTRMTCSFLDTGVPHAVLFVDNIEHIDVETLGKKIRHDPLFQPRGTNVNFVEKRGLSQCLVRTFERGVEQETLACGTGATASAIALYTEEGTTPITVIPRSGDRLEIAIELDAYGKISETYQEGPAELIFTGSYPLDSFN